MVLALDGGDLVNVFQRDLSSYVVAWGGQVGRSFHSKCSCKCSYVPGRELPFSIPAAALRK